MTEYEKEIAIIEKMGLKTSPLRLEYENKVHDLRSVPEKLKAEGFSEEQIARAMHEKRRELGRQYKKADEMEIAIMLYCIVERITTGKFPSPVLSSEYLEC